MRLTKQQAADITSVARQMKGMADEMNAFAQRGKVAPVAPVHSKPRPAQLQISQTGGWRAAVNFDLNDVPEEFLQAADSMARLSGTHIGMRVVECIPNGSGGTVPSRHVLMHWSRERAKGWVKA